MIFLQIFFLYIYISIKIGSDVLMNELKKLSKIIANNLDQFDIKRVKPFFDIHYCSLLARIL